MKSLTRERTRAELRRFAVGGPVTVGTLDGTRYVLLWWRLWIPVRRIRRAVFHLVLWTILLTATASHRRQRLEALQIRRRQ